MRVCFNDEAPRIGSGWRLIEVCSVGPKWVKIRAGGHDRVTLRRSVWDQIVKYTERRQARQS
jgi:hypothetical protein